MTDSSQNQTQQQQAFLPLTRGENTLHNHIHVSVRMKPLTETEHNLQRIRGGPQWIVTNERTITDRTAREHFHFDKVFKAEMSTRDIFKDDLQPMVVNALKGYNVTILAYGQTSSGKTYTISGSGSSEGLIYLTAQELFKGLNYLSSAEGIKQYPTTPETRFIERQTKVRVSFMELYNECVNDLLDISKRNLEVREHRSGEVFVDTLTQKTVKSLSELMQCAADGDQVRVFAETKANKNSSRSHTIFRISLETCDIN